MVKQSEKIQEWEFHCHFLWWCMGQKTLLLICSFSWQRAVVFGVRHQVTDHVSNRNPNSLLGKWLLPIILNDPELLPFSAKWVLGEFQSQFLANQYLSKSPEVQVWVKQSHLLPFFAAGDSTSDTFVTVRRMQLCRTVQCTFADFFKLLPWSGYLG